MKAKKKSMLRPSLASPEFEQLKERGRQLHNQAVFDLFVGLVYSIILCLKKVAVFPMRTGTQGTKPPTKGIQAIHQHQ